MSLPATNELQHYLRQPTDPRHAHNPIAVAHAALEKLREQGDPQGLFVRVCCEQTQLVLLSSPSVDAELWFHCVTGARQVILQHWQSYSPAYRQAVRNLWTTPLPPESCSRTNQLACWTAAVALWKRGWNEETVHNTAPPSAVEQQIMQQIHQLPLSIPALTGTADLFAYLEQPQQRQQPTQQQQPTTPQSIAATAQFWSCLIGEFSGTSAVTYRMPLEFHKAAHRSLEKDKDYSLHRILQWNIRVLVAQQQPPPPVLQLLLDITGWEFGLTAWSVGFLGASVTGRTLIRPPFAWRDALLNLDLVRALFQWHAAASPQQKPLLRQVLIALASLNGPIFENENEKHQYAAVFLQGAMPLLAQVSTGPLDDESSTIFCCDSLQLVSRLVSNYKLGLLSQIPTLVPLLQHFTVTGTHLLAAQTRECEECAGDLDAMVGREFREQALEIILEGAVLMCGDPWLLYTGTEESRKQVQRSLSSLLGPLYAAFLQCRTRMAALEEHYHMNNNEASDDGNEAEREEIAQADLEEELASVATVGRLDLSAAVATLSQLFQQTMPQLQVLWQTTGSDEVTAETAAMLEQARLLNLYITHLLTDDNKGEDPNIPLAVLAACREQPGLSKELAGAVSAVLQFAQAQAQKIAENPSNRRLSPLLACSFLVFCRRWAPAYICPEEVLVSASAVSNPISQEWSSPETAQNNLSLCLSLCLNYHCFWPQEQLVQEQAGIFLMAIATRGPKLRSFVVASPVFQQLVRCHVLTAGIRHSASRDEFIQTVQAKLGSEADPSTMSMVWGFQRLPYTDKSRIFTAILVACSDTDNPKANEMVNESLKAVHDAFTSFIRVLSSSKPSGYQDVNAREMACLCVEMMCGIAHASEMKSVERIPPLLTTYIPDLAGLMEHYAEDLTLCESLLRFFRDYTESFIATLDREQSLALFDGAAKLLKSYSQYHCHSRAIVKTNAEAEAEEEKAFSDILCALQLLINLGSKDFVDACSGNNGVESSQVTDVIFFGMQQILPLMTQGLLQFPNLCLLFFELVGFMTEMYPDKLSILPYDLFSSLVESLLFGMSHHNAQVAKLSLYGLASIVKEHIKAQTLQPQLDRNPAVLDQCSQRLLTEVIFQTVVTDRIEAAGMALMPLVAVDVARFAAVVQNIVSTQVPHPEHQQRLQAAFDKLIQPQIIAQVSAEGYEGRMNRARFREGFETFVGEVHAFLVLR